MLKIDQVARALVKGESRKKKIFTICRPAPPADDNPCCSPPPPTLPCHLRSTRSESSTRDGEGPVLLGQERMAAAAAFADFDILVFDIGTSRIEQTRRRGHCLTINRSTQRALFAPSHSFTMC